MKGPAKENELAKRSTEMNNKLPLSYDNKDYGIKRKAKLHKFSVKDTKNNKFKINRLYGKNLIVFCRKLNECAF